MVGSKRGALPKAGWFALLLLFSAAMALVALPPAPASAQASTTYWLGRSTGTEYVFDVPLPADLGAMLTCAPPKFAAFAAICKKSSPAAGGGSSVVRTAITWDLDLIDRGTVSYRGTGSFQMSWWQNLDPKGAGWQQATDELKRQAIVSGTWKNADVQVNVTQDASAAPLRLPIPELTLARTAMSKLAATTVSGTFYPTVKVPADLDGYRAQMLAYGNAGRRDPDFRRNNGMSIPVDITGDTVVTKTGATEKVFKQNATPPYFADHRLNAELNRAAQFQAEFLASEGKPMTLASHLGPTSYTDPRTGKTVSMYTLTDRGRFFNTPPAVEAASGSGPGGSPHDWMSGTTHFRPWFNVAGTYPRIGYGIAKAANGNWYTVAVPEINEKGESPPLDKIALPLTDTVGAKPSGPLTVTVDAGPTAPAPPSGVPTTGPPAAAASGGVANDPTAGAGAPATGVPTTGAAGGAAGEVPQATLTSVCEGFAAYLRQEVASKQATLTVGPGRCDVTSPDLQVAQLGVSSLTDNRAAERALGCEDIAKGRATDAQAYPVQALGERKQAVMSSGSSGQSFPFIVGSQQVAGKDVSVRAMACDGTYQYWARLDRAEGVNPLLAVNAAAEGMRRAAA